MFVKSRVNLKRVKEGRGGVRRVAPDISSILNSISLFNVGGELLMAETGCLGVICSCHNMYMSVAKFAEVSAAENRYSINLIFEYTSPFSCLVNFVRQPLFLQSI